MDVATLAYQVDSSGLERGERALDDTTKAAENAGKAVEQLDDRFKGIARRAVEFAEAKRVGNQSERSLAEAAREAAAGIDTKTQIMARSGTEAERMARRVDQMRAAEEKQAKAAEAAARATQLQELNLKKLVGQIDPTIAKLEKLAQQESQLEKALDLGAINPQVFQQYQSRIEATRAATLNAGKASDVMTKSLGNLNLQTVETQQSVAALVRALATGQWGQAQASMTSLTARTGAMGGVFSTAGLAIGGVAAVLGTFAVMAGKGYVEARQLEGVLLGTGTAAGETADSILNLRDGIGRISGNYADATTAINQLLLSGKATGDTLEEIARSATNLATLTGQSVGSITSELLGLSDSGAEGLAKLNERYNFLTIDAYKNIEAIREQSGEFEAQKAILAELDRVAEDRARNMVQSAGWIEAAWNGVKQAVGEVKRSLMDLGRGSEGTLAIMDRLRAFSQVNLPGSGLPGLAGFAADIMETGGRRDRLKVEGEQAKYYAEQMGLANVETKEFIRNQQEYAKIKPLDETERGSGGGRSSARRAQVSEEQKEAERLLQQYQSAEASLARQIALHGTVGREAAMAYDTAYGSLRNFTDAQKASLIEAARWSDWLDEMAAFDSITDKISEEQAKVVSNTMGAMDQYAIQAARNMQTHFADFLFDPMKNGFKGMADGFAETLRRMAAEAAASQLFKQLGTWGTANKGSGGWMGAIASIFSSYGGGNANGGDTSMGKYYRVGESRPEMYTENGKQYLIPGNNGRVNPMAPARAGVMGSPVVNITLVGAPEGTTATASQNGQGGFDVEVMMGQIRKDIAGNIASGGVVGSAIKNRYNVGERV